MSDVNEEHNEFVKAMVKKSQEKDPEPTPSFGLLGPDVKDAETQAQKNQVTEEFIDKVEKEVKRIKEEV